ncbi:MAG: UDP-N-acetylmuramate dehydrogenase [Coprococcus sp.]|nr:UDP-N-acetylmuramate dehydrogenase [Coprococcus sp.]
MSSIDILSSITEIVGAGNVLMDEQMKCHTTFRVGGPADFFVKPQNERQLAGVIRYLDEYKIPFFILGNGSNLLVSDSGYRGVIIDLSEGFDDISVSGNFIFTQAGAMLSRVSAFARDNSLTGMEFASGIPGSIGGAVFMNAGAYGGEMKDIVDTVTVMDYSGNIFVLKNSDMDFGYRHSVVEEKKLIVLSTVLRLSKGDRSVITGRMKELGESRISKQPLEYPSAGSTFKRPEGYFAGKLIMDAGLRGKSIGGAQVAEKHCGFIINKGGATAKDIAQLIRYVQNEVKCMFGVSIEPEVRFLGDFTEL